ncbi:hypothetical protein HBI81_215390 [Parastagonospora nodorum]|nr:hypothetical protein HBI95_146180 [Parastagonospora nodorum]KAH6513714.1 hypothetical protein HBI81_215390 [Parastagonospora nodorum]
MPGLPKNLLSSYQRYKNHMDQIVQWLASTAKKHGYVASKGIGAIKAPNPYVGPQTYTVALKEWLILGEFVAKQAPPIIVPAKLADIIEVSIRIRQTYKENIPEDPGDSGEERMAQSQNTLFLNMLRKLRHILEPLLPTERNTPEISAEVFNLFEQLDLEEPSEALEQAPDIIPSHAASSGPIYMAERPTDFEESSFALLLLLHDLHKLRAEVSTAWSRYKMCAEDLVAAAITTNTAVDLARSMVDDMKSIFSKYGGEICMLELWYNAECSAAGTSESHRDQPGDEMNVKVFNIANIIFWSAHQLLTAFCNDLRRIPFPDMKRGTQKYVPQSDRNSKSLRELFAEDKEILLEMLPEFFYYCHTTKADASRPPVEDELSRGLRTMFETKEVTLPLAFAATLFLDIQHILDDRVDEGFRRMSDATHFVQANIEEELKFHEGIELATWPKENDMAVQQFVDTLQFWCHEDQQLSTAIRMKQHDTTGPFFLYRRHPWMCGVWKYYAQMRFHEISIVLVNAWGSIMSCAHLYNAMRRGTPREAMWKDFEVMAARQDAKTFFLGDAPESADDCLERYELAMGASAFNLPKSTRKKKGLIHSKGGLKGLRELGLVHQAFKGRYCDGQGQTDLRADDVQKILDHATWEFKLNEQGHVEDINKDTTKTTTNLPVTKVLKIIHYVIQAEVSEILFDYLRLHRQCWRLLRFVKGKCRQDLIKLFGSDYITKESELPFVVGYVLMSAASTQEAGSLLKARLPGVLPTNKVLEDAIEVVVDMIREGAGALIVDHVLLKGLGVHIDIEYPEE